MISKVFIVVSVVFILLGLIGVVKKDIRIKLIFLSITTVGMLMLAFAQGEVGMAGTVIAGLWQMAYQLPALLCFIILTHNICKQNNIQRGEDLVGTRQAMPYLFAAGVIFAIVLIGFPGTGTFNGYFLTAFGLMLDQTLPLSCVGLCGLVAGIAINAAITFSILKPAYLPSEHKPKSAPKAGMVYIVLAVLFILASVFYDYAAVVISGIEDILR